MRGGIHYGTSHLRDVHYNSYFRALWCKWTVEDLCLAYGDTEAIRVRPGHIQVVEMVGGM